MPCSLKEQIRVTNYLCRLRGGSQPILVRASDDNLYVVKFFANPQGQNLLFNEAAGSELFKAMRLPVPEWKPLRLGAEFLEAHPLIAKMGTKSAGMQCHSSICFGSRYMGGDDQSLLEILPSSSFKRVRNLEAFLMAWVLDVAAGHTDNRQALFLREETGRLKAVFVDHGNMFGGAAGTVNPHAQASAYLDKRIYPQISSATKEKMIQHLNKIDPDRLWKRVLVLPEEWTTQLALANFSRCLEQLANACAMESIVEQLLYFVEMAHRQTKEVPYERKHTLALPRPGFDFCAGQCSAIA